MEKRVNRRKFLSGIVISDKMQKTRVVQITWVAKHQKYNKTVRKAVKYKVHDENNSSKVGDIVRIMETRPLSKDKRWILREITKAQQEA